MTYITARRAMVDTQIRPNGVRDPQIIEAFLTVSREAFVPDRLKPVAYSDDALAIWPFSSDRPIRALLAPMMLAKFLEHAALRRTDLVLDIGGLTGYSAAIAGRLCKRVFALEANPEIAKAAEAALASAAAENVTTVSGPLTEGWAANAPYDVILLNGCSSTEPRFLFDQLAEGGRLVCVVGQITHGQATLFTKTQKLVTGRPIFDAGIETLPGYERKPQFVF